MMSISYEGRGCVLGRGVISYLKLQRIYGAIHDSYIMIDRCVVLGLIMRNCVITGIGFVRRRDQRDQRLGRHHFDRTVWRLSPSQGQSMHVHNFRTANVLNS